MRPHRNPFHYFREKYCERGTLFSGPSTRAEANSAAMPGHDILNHPQAKARAFSFFGCGKGIEDLTYKVRCDSGSVIGNHYPDIFPAESPVAGRANVDRDLRRISLSCICDQAGEQLPHFARKPFYVPGAFIAALNLDVLRYQLRSQGF